MIDSHVVRFPADEAKVAELDRIIQGAIGETAKEEPSMKRPSGRTTGIAVAALAAFLSTYELIALVTPAPTISRIVQGWRDSCGPCAVGVGVLSAVVVLALGAFARWVGPHLRKDRRSSL